MKPPLVIVAIASLFIGGAISPHLIASPSPKADQLEGDKHNAAVLTKMVQDREAAMKNKDLAAVMMQFSSDATFINSSGDYCANKSEIEAFHKQLMFGKGVDYKYAAGKVTVRLLDANNALVYYPWKMDFFHGATPAKFFYHEVGLMTLSARKNEDGWMWVAITNQHVPAFFEDLANHKASK